MDSADVNRLLDASRAAHAQYRLVANPAPPGLPNYSVAETAVALAAELRQKAHDLDPEHRSSGWAEDKVPHGTLVAFYRKYPLIP